jgi:hypothetical protein
MAIRLPRGPRPVTLSTRRAIPVGDCGKDYRGRDLTRVWIRVRLANRNDRRAFQRFLTSNAFGTERIGEPTDHYCGRVDLSSPASVAAIPQGATVTSDGLAVYRDGEETWELWGDHDEVTGFWECGYPWILDYGYVTDARIPGVGQGSGPEKASGGRSRPVRPRITDDELSSEVHGVVIHDNDVRAVYQHADERRRADLSR